MRKIVTSYATERYYQAIDSLERTAVRIGKADLFIKYKYDDVKDSKFFQENKHIISRCGNKICEAQYWIWKPFIILEAMKSCDDGDIVLYIDAGMIVVDDLDPLFEIAKNNKDNRILFSASKIYGRHLNLEYTKRDCFILMGCDEPQYWNTRMLNASMSVWMKTQTNISFLSEWREYVSDSRIVTDDPNTCGQPNFQDFREHRFDQSVLSLLSVKYNSEIYRDPSQYSVNENYENSPYKQLVLQHNIHLQ